MTIPFLVVTFNRVTGLESAMEFCRRSTLPVEPVILDMGSTWEVFWDRVAQLDAQVLHVGAIGGPRRLWDGGILTSIATGPFVLSDGDIDYSDTRADALELAEGYLSEFPWLEKVGLALRLDGLPADTQSDRIRAWEAQFWQVPWDDLAYLADVDTTVAYYPGVNRPFAIGPALRLGGGASVRHYPWYEREDSLSLEAVEYRDRADLGLTTQAGAALPSPNRVRGKAHRMLLSATRLALKSPLIGPHVAPRLRRTIKNPSA